MIDLSSTVKKDNFLESALIDVIDYETKVILFSKIKILLAARKLNIRAANIYNFLNIKNIRGYYENKKTKKRYIFKLSKNEN